MEAGSPLPNEVYSPEWWAQFFGWERMVQNEFVHEAIEMALGLSKGWGDGVWGDIADAADHGSVHIIPQPFDVRHAMVLISTNHIDDSDPAGPMKLVDIHGKHDEMPFGIEGVSLAEWRQIKVLATRRLGQEFAWIAGWRMHCWETEEGDVKKRLDPSQHGKN